MFLTKATYTQSICSGFGEHFLALGLRCLPRSAFLQYVEQGIFQLSEKVVLDVISNKDEVRTDGGTVIRVLYALWFSDTHIRVLRSWLH
jgi:hypothetical protein